MKRTRCCVCLLLGVGLLLLAVRASAAPGVTIKSSKGQQTEFTLGAGVTKIFVTALTTDMLNPAFQWTLNGSGAFDGERTDPGLWYVLPDRLTGATEQGPISVTVTAQDGAQTTASITFTLRASRAAQMPPPEPTRTPSNPTPGPSPTGRGEVSCWENPKKGAVCKEDVTGMEFVWIPGGQFQMGCCDAAQAKQGTCVASGESCDSDEQPAHPVTVDGFWMGKYEVTQAQWQKIMDSNPAYFNESKVGKDRPNHPVEQVSWNAVQEFIKKFNAQTGQTFRLPTEAEWEYAARAGTTTPFSFGSTISTDQANYDGNYVYGSGKKGVYRQQTTPVGSFPANAFGLYDMHGNVWEWCADWYDSGYYANSPQDNPPGPSGGSKRVLRGGSWNYGPRDVRSADRYDLAPSYRSGSVGFRVLRTK